MTPFTINKDFNRLFYSLGFRKEPKRRHEFSVHGFRKWFKTTTERAGMRLIDVETLMGHSIGVSGSYYRPTETDLQNSYISVAQYLVIAESLQTSKLVVEQKKAFEDQLMVVNRKVDELIARFVGSPPSAR